MNKIGEKLSKTSDTTIARGERLPNRKRSGHTASALSTGIQYNGHEMMCTQELEMKKLRDEPSKVSAVQCTYA